MQTPPVGPFNPSPALANGILELFTNPEYTLQDIADGARCTLRQIAAWLATPPIALELRLLQEAFSTRTKMLAANGIPGVVKLLQRMVADSEDILANRPIEPNNLRSHEFSRRSQETGRRASVLLHRLATTGTLPATQAPKRSVKVQTPIAASTPSATPANSPAPNTAAATETSAQTAATPTEIQQANEAPATKSNTTSIIEQPHAQLSEQAAPAAGSPIDIPDSPSPQPEPQIVQSSLLVNAL